MKHKPIFCKICNTQTNCGITTFGRWHLERYHPEYNTKKYYDDFFKLEKEGICECGKETQFISFNRGYLKYCSYKCVGNSNDVKRKAKKTKKEKYDDEKYTNRIKAKSTCFKKYGFDNVSKIE